MFQKLKYSDKELKSVLHFFDRVKRVFRDLSFKFELMLLRRVSADYLNPFLNEDKSLDLSVGYNLI